MVAISISIVTIGTNADQPEVAFSWCNLFSPNMDQLTEKAYQQPLNPDQKLEDGKAESGKSHGEGEQQQCYDILNLEICSIYACHNP